MTGLLCFLRGHVPGGPVVFTYQRRGRFLEQRPDLRGQTAIRIIGTACPRCGAIRSAEMGPELVEAVGEMVEAIVTLDGTMVVSETE